MAMLEIRDREDVVVVSFTHAKILDERVIHQIGQEFGKLTTEAAADRKLLLNFANVEFMASAMLGQIIRLSKQCKQDKVRLKLCNISPNIMEVFVITNLTKILEIHKTEEEAIEAFGPPKRRWLGK